MTAPFGRRNLHQCSRSAIQRQASSCEFLSRPVYRGLSWPDCMRRFNAGSKRRTASPLTAASSLQWFCLSDSSVCWTCRLAAAFSGIRLTGSLTRACQTSCGASRQPRRCWARTSLKQQGLCLACNWWCTAAFGSISSPFDPSPAALFSVTDRGSLLSATPCSLIPV